MMRLIDAFRNFAKAPTNMNFANRLNFVKNTLFAFWDVIPCLLEQVWIFHAIL